MGTPRDGMSGVHLVSAPVDYSENIRVLVDELRTYAATSTTGNGATHSPIR
jgi:hypothetical protein